RTNRGPERTNAFAVGIRREIRGAQMSRRCGGREIQFRRTRRRRTGTASVSPCTTPRQGLRHLGRALPFAFPREYLTQRALGSEALTPLHGESRLHATRETRTGSHPRA